MCLIVCLLAAVAASQGYAGWYTLENPVGDTLDDAVRQTAVLRHWLKEASRGSGR